MRSWSVLALVLLVACGRGRGVDDPANELPFGHVDQPVNGASVDAVGPVSGWALDDRGIAQIRVYVDGHIVNSGGLTDQRPDVSSAFPQYAHKTHLHGFTLLMGFDAPGPHTVLVQAVDTNGATRDIGVVNVTAVDR